MSIETLSKQQDTGHNSRNKPDVFPEEAVKDTVHDIGEKVGGKVSHMADSAVDNYQRSRTYVKRHPVTGVVAATAAGMVLGSLLTAVFRRKV